MLLMLYGGDLLLLSLLSVAYSDHLHDVETETQGDESEHDGKEQFLVTIGKALYIGGYLIELGSLGELASGSYLSLITVFVLGIVLVWHLLS